jgi:hypothetical protein
MERGKLGFVDCDALDIAALWPCSAQLGTMPIPEVAAGARGPMPRQQSDDDEA